MIDKKTLCKSDTAPKHRTSQLAEHIQLAGASRDEITPVDQVARVMNLHARIPPNVEVAM
jgi:hypothetical protein